MLYKAVYPTAEFEIIFLLLICINSKGNLDISTVEYTILDEVDQMLDMGFAPAVEEIFSNCYTSGTLKFYCFNFFLDEFEKC